MQSEMETFLWHLLLLAVLTFLLGLLVAADIRHLPVVGQPRHSGPDRVGLGARDAATAEAGLQPVPESGD